MLFGQKPLNGLLHTKLPQDIIATLETEEDLEEVLEGFDSTNATETQVEDLAQEMPEESDLGRFVNESSSDGAEAFNDVMEDDLNLIRIRREDAATGQERSRDEMLRTTQNYRRTGVQYLDLIKILTA